MQRGARLASVTVLAALLLATERAEAIEPIQIRPASRDVTLGESNAVRLELAVPADTRNVEFVTNVGRVEGLARIGPNRFEAVFVPPQTHFPQVAVIVAWSATGAGAATLRLWARSVLPVETEPDTTVVLEVGSRRFGPVPASSTGHAEIALHLPPGPGGGVVVATSRAGTVTRRNLDLHVPEVSRVVTLARPDAVVAGSAERPTILVAGAMAEGGPAGQTSAHAERGRVERSYSLGDGLTAIRYDAGTLAGLSTLGVAVAGAGRASVRIEVRPGPPTGIRIDARPERVPADGRTIAQIAASFVDAFGNPTGPATEVRWEGAEPTHVVRDATAYRAQLDPRRLGENRRVPSLVRIVASGRGLRSERSLAYYDPGAYLLTADPQSLHLIADGRAHATIHVVARDAAGRPAPAGTEVVVEPREVAAPARLALVNGAGDVEVVAGTHAGRGQLALRIGDQAVHVRILLDPGPPARLRARVDPGVVDVPGGVAPRIFARVEDANGNFVAALRPSGTATVGVIEPFVPAPVEGGWWVARYRPPSSVGPGAATIRIDGGAVSTELAVRLEALDRFDAGARAGVLWNLGAAWAPTAAIEATARLPLLGRRLVAGAEVFAISGGGTATSNDGPMPFSYTTLAVALTAGYRAPSDALFRPFGGVVLGVGWAWQSGTPPGSPEIRETATAPVVGAFLGIGRRLGPGAAFLEARFSWMPASGPLDGNLAGLGLSLGYRFRL